VSKELSPTQRRRLLQNKRKIEALLPLVSEKRARNMRVELDEINAVLGLSGRVDPQKLLASPVASAGVEGVGGLAFQAPSPPGLGRLIRVPFYLTSYTGPTGVTAMLTDGGFDAPAIANPTVIASIPAPAARNLAGMTFQTPQISWADLRVVGFQAAQTPFTPVFFNLDILVTVETLRPFLLVKELFVGGGANLFSQEGYIDAILYSPLVPEFAGLRENPLLLSPSVATVSAAISGQTILVGPVLQRASITFALNLVCEILDDDNHGRHIPGPYVRRDALIRRPNPRGNFPRLS